MKHEIVYISNELGEKNFTICGSAKDSHNPKVLKAPE